MSFDISSSSMPTPTEMRTSCENPEKAEKLRGWQKLVDLDEEESEEWRNIFQERFDRRTGGDRSKAPFFLFDVFNKLLDISSPGGFCQRATCWWQEARTLLKWPEF